MPELPEVEVVKKSLKKRVLNLVIQSVEIRNKFLRFPIEVKKLKNMAKAKILSIKRRSKYILINLNNNYTILIHLGMTGKIIIINDKKQKFKTSFYYNLDEKDYKHDHLIIRMNKKVSLIYNDIRKFGFIKILKTKKLKTNSHFKNLGPEPLSKHFNFSYFVNKAKNKKKSIKDLLMDQSFVSGLGNIYVNEVLFLSKINPRKKIINLKKNNITYIIKNTKNILKKAIKKGGSSIKDFSNLDGKSGNFQQFFNVYGMSQKRCSNIYCKGIIKKIKQSNRSTFFCTICQK